MKKFSFLVLLTVLSVFYTESVSAQVTIISTSNSNYRNTSYKSSMFFPSSTIKESWDRGERISSIAHGSNKWLVFFTDELGYGEQKYKQQSTFPKNWLKENWDAGLRVTDIAYGNEGWVVVMSDIGYHSEQSYNYVDYFPTDWIIDQYNMGRFITSISFGGGMWAIVTSSNSGIYDQTWDMHDTSKYMSTYKNQQMLKEGYIVSDIALYYGEHLTIYSRGLHGTSQTTKYIENSWLFVNSWIDGRFKLGQTITVIDGSHRPYGYIGSRPHNSKPHPRGSYKKPSAPSHNVKPAPKPTPTPALPQREPAIKQPTSTSSPSKKPEPKKEEPKKEEPKKVETKKPEPKKEEPKKEEPKKEEPKKTTTTSKTTPTTTTSTTTTTTTTTTSTSTSTSTRKK